MVKKPTYIYRGSGLFQELADFEKQVYDFIKEREEVLISSIPARMRGAIPTLKKVGARATILEV